MVKGEVKVGRKFLSGDSGRFHFTESLNDRHYPGDEVSGPKTTKGPIL